jgi:Tfx family DNA-binding protein
MALSSFSTLRKGEMNPVREDSAEGEKEEAEEAEAGESPESLFTERQLQVLQLRLRGLSQQEVADMLGTTRSNISILEKRAHQNILRAERTLKQWMMIRAPISLKANAGTDVFDLPKMIFEAADKRSIRLPVTSLDIIVQLRRKAPGLFKRRALEKDAEIFATEEGEILVNSKT